MFTIAVRAQAQKELDRIDEPYWSLISKNIDELTHQFFLPGKKCKRIQGEKDVYRIRVGSYRIIYHVNHFDKLITILRIFSRGEGY